MCKFKIGDKVKRINYSNQDVVQGAVYTVRGFDAHGDLEFEGLPDFGYAPEAFEIYTAETPTLYTESELSEIEELRDRVEYLESLCEDYTKVIAEKDNDIESMQKVIDELPINGCINGW